LLDALVERQVLKGVERIMVNEDRDRPLRRQIVRCVLNGMLEKSGTTGAGVARRGLAGENDGVFQGLEVLCRKRKLAGSRPSRSISSACESAANAIAKIP
jgi:hypothetical protein